MVIKYMGRGPVFGLGGIFKCLGAEFSLLVAFLFIGVFGIASLTLLLSATGYA
jgi:hypothetical protein